VGAILGASTDGFHIPLFQRRYCWGEAQWAQLWTCLLKVCDDSGQEHSLGRFLVQKQSPEQHMVVLDGQQRITSCSVLFSAFRDRAVQLRDVAGCDQSSKLARMISELQQMLHRGDGGLLLRPTLDDMDDFRASITQRTGGLPAGGVLADNGQIGKCKAYFGARLATLGTDELGTLCNAAAAQLTMTMFVVRGKVQPQKILAIGRRRCR
jgi:hypothetical protein